MEVYYWFTILGNKLILKGFFINLFKFRYAKYLTRTFFSSKIYQLSYTPILMVKRIIYIIF